MKILVIHHTDLDGAGAAAIVGLYHEADSEVVYRMYNYGWTLSPEDLQGYDKIYAVDVSFGQDNPWVYSIPGLIWIDHHKTALEYEAENLQFHQIPGLRRIGVGACELTWEYLFPDQPCPPLIQVLSTYDVWDKERMDWELVEEIETGAKHILGISPTEIMKFIKSGLSPMELQITGKTILGYIEKSGKGKLKGSGFWIPYFYGYRVIALCTSDFSSQTFMSYYNPEIFDICMPFQIVPSDIMGKFFVRVSLYTENPNIDVSEIAKIYGGGGHRGAAGFQIDLETLTLILKESQSLKSYLSFIKFQGNPPRHE